MFRRIDIIPLQEHYDGILVEPKHFLPLVPIALLNPQEGIAVGFASTILPRSLEAIVKSQIAYLEDTDFYVEMPHFAPTNQKAVDWAEDKDGRMTKFIFHGEFKKVNATTVEITNLPYGLVHEKYIEHLLKLEDEGTVQEFEDNSKDHYSITVRFKKGTLRSLNDEDVLRRLGLINTESENMTLIDFDGEHVLKTTYGEFVQLFCDWRLEFYYDRYKRLADLLDIDIQRYKDILLAIKKNVGGIAKKIASRAELKEFLKEIGVIHIDYIADLAVYRFTEEEKKKVEQRLKDALTLMKEYNALLKSKTKRRKVYIEELREVLKKKGSYYVSA